MTTETRLGDLSALKLALMAKKVRDEAQPVLLAEPIAVIGIGCRVPGGGDAPDRLWELVRAGVDAVREVPADRWDGDAWFDRDPAVAGKSATKWGGFIDRIDAFDPAFFGILSREAERMDPQQRLFLEVAIEALDDAGLPRERLRGSRTGVFAASYHDDYAHLQYADLEAIDARTLTGTLHSVLANRLSHFLDLRGPSLALDTACSSSLVAVHLACQSLRAGESDVALAGGVSLMVTPELMVALSKVGFMAPDGRCKAFDAAADGFGRGEGCGVVVLKRLADAVADGDRVLAVVRGSAVNQDGHSTVLTAPNGLAQRALIEEALARAHVEPSRIGYVEAHGTGTQLGDPIEVEALAATVGQPVAGAGTCFLGSVKSNMGHLEAAAGVVGLIKTVLVLRHEAVPPQARFVTLNPHISLDGTRLCIPTALVPWPPGARPRCAAVSSFGVGGTNAHIVLEEAPRLPSRAPAPEVSRVLPLSAHGPAALRATAEAWTQFLPRTGAAPADLCYTAAERRTHQDHRLAVVGRTKEELCARLSGYLEGGEVQGVASGSRAASAPPRIAFVFSGQGPQWHAMGRELLAQEPVFRSALGACDELLRPLSGWSLLDELEKDEARSRLDQTVIAQPALFALQVALAALWRSWGITPASVVGHSVGEIAALQVAGALALPEAVRVVWHRARIMQEATGLGRMAQVALPGEAAAELVRPFDGRLSVAAVNAPRSSVLSGEDDALEAALAALSARGLSHRMLPVKYAFHSAQMAPFQLRLAEALGSVDRSAPMVAVYSTVTGALATAERFDATYFGRNVREPVRFASAIGAMAVDGHDLFLELGPHPVLGGAIAECLEAGGHAGRALASLRRGRCERDTLLEACAALYAAGCSPAWDAVQRGGNIASLPAYPWQRKRYWIRPRPIAPAPSRPAAGGHPLLGTRLDAAGVRSRIFEGGWDGTPAWLADHRIFGRLALPGAAALETLHAAAQAVLGSGASIRGFTMERPLFLPEPGEGRARWQVVVTPAAPGHADLELHEPSPRGELEEGWRRVASATAEVEPAPATQERGDDEGAAEAIAPATVYARFAALGAEFGPAFRSLREIRRGEGVAEGWIELPEGSNADVSGHALHPLLLDGALQLCSVAAARGEGGELPAAAFLPVGADRLRISGSAGGRVFARVRVRQETRAGSVQADVRVESAAGEVVAAIDGMRFARAEPAALAPSSAGDRALYGVSWQRLDPRPSTQLRTEGTWLVLSGAGAAGEALARELEAAGARCVRASPGPAFARTARDAWTVDVASPADLRRLLAEAGALRGAVHLLALDVAPLQGAAQAGADQDELWSVGSLLHLVQALAQRDGAAPLSVVTRGAQVVTGEEPAEALRPRTAAAWGLASVVAVEHPEMRVRRLDLDPAAAGIGALARELLCADEASASIALRGETRWAPRLTPRSPAAARNTADAHQPLRLEMARPGTFDGIELRPTARCALRPDEVRIRVLACGLNFRDVLLALGMYPGGGGTLGAECAGVVTEIGTEVGDLNVGARVLGFARASLATEVTCPASFVVPAPPALNDEQAAAIPVAFLTAWYGLHRLARLRAGERVLVHAAAGGVGLAAVQLGLRCGAEVIATAGSEAKRELLRSMGVHHVFDSRSLGFAEAIRAATSGEGVHVVLNSLAGEFIGASLGVLAQGGRFLEIGKRGILTTEEARRLRPDVQYHAYDLGAAADADRGLLRPMLEAILAAIAAGELRPLPLTVFPLGEAREAFRFMAQARHVGKIVLLPAPAAPLVSSAATYWITGGLGGVGIETARWLARSGARHLVLSGRRAPGPAGAAAVRELEEQGVRVRVVQADASDREATRRVLDDIRETLPPLRGVVHAAGVTDDAVLLRQTWERCRRVLAGKARGAWALHELTRDLPLDFFVLYSAAGLLLGAPGQGAYPAANAELDALAQARHRLGLPALSVSWGWWGDVGMAAELAARGRDVWAARGLGKITPQLGFARLEELLREGETHAAVLPIRWPRFLAELPPGADRAFFREVAGNTGTNSGAQPAPHAPGLVARLQALLQGQRRPALMTYVTERALQVVGLDAAAAVDPRVPLKEVGLDSLMAIELRNTLARSIGRPLPSTLVFDHPTLDALVDHLAGVLGLETEGARRVAATAPGTSGREDEVVGLSDAEAEALLLAELERKVPRDH